MIVNYYYDKPRSSRYIDIGEPPDDIQNDDEELYEWVMDQAPVQLVFADEWEISECPSTSIDR